MKKTYETVEMEITEFETEDVIATSNPTDKMIIDGYEEILEL